MLNWLQPAPVPYYKKTRLYLDSKTLTKNANFFHFSSKEITKWLLLRDLFNWIIRFFTFHSPCVFYSFRGRHFAIVSFFWVFINTMQRSPYLHLSISYFTMVNASFHLPTNHKKVIWLFHKISRETCVVKPLIHLFYSYY